MSSNMFAGRAVEFENGPENGPENEFENGPENGPENEFENGLVTELVSIDGFKTCEGRKCGVMTPEFCECDGAGFFPEPLEEAPPAALVRRDFVLKAINLALGGVLMAKATEMFPNPPGSKFACPFRVANYPHQGYYIISVFAPTAEAADDMLRQFTTTVKLYVSSKNTYLNVTHVKPETLDNFFREKNFRKLGPYTFNLVETPEGLFIQMNRDAVNILFYPTVEAEFWNIFQTLMNCFGSGIDIHILNELRKLSPEVDTAVKERNAAFKQKEPVARSADGNLSRPATLGDFFAKLEVAPARGGKKKGKKN